jgi:tetratricopeptide (TPR) repeat protein
VSAHLGEQAHRWDLNSGSTTPITTHELETAKAAGRRLVELDTSYGGDDLTRLAVRAFRSAYHRLASGLYVPAVERDLQAVVGELGQVAAWIAYDADDQPLSRQLTTEALLHSRAAGDRRMELFELSQLAMQAVHLRHPAEALRIADEVIDSHPASARVTAVFRIRRARALAQMGDRARALNEHDRVAATLADGVSSADPDWTWWVDTAELAWHRAMSLTDLDRWSTAIDQFHTAYDLRPAEAHRARYNDLAHLLEAQVAGGAHREAEVSLTAVVARVADVQSARTAAILHRVTDRVSRAHAAPSTLTDAAHALIRALDDLG